MSGEIARIGMWLRQYAIRMPNGELYSDVAPQAPVDDYSIPSPMRDMLGLGSWFGMMSTPAPATRVPTGPVIFSDYPAAKAKLDELRKAARAVGVTVYGGEIVERLCTPFSTGDLVAQFNADLIEWLEQHGGAQ